MNRLRYVALSLLSIPNRVSPLCYVPLRIRSIHQNIIHDLSAEPLSRLRYTFLGHVSSFTNIQHVGSKADLAIDFNILISGSGYNKSIWKLNNDAYPDLPSDQICTYNIYVYIQIWKKKA